MLLLKGFFRKKSTKVYLIIYSIIMATIMCSLFLIKYNQKVLNDITKKLSYLTLTSSKDYYNEILNVKNVEGVQRMLLFAPDDDCKTFKHISYTLYNTDGTIVESNNKEENENKVNWENYTGASNSIYIMSDKNYQLNDNEIALSKKGIEYVDSEIVDKLIGQKISFLYNNQKVEFTIKMFYDSKNTEMTISENKFNELLSNNIYLYKIYIHDYSKEKQTIEQLENINNDRNVEVDGAHIYDGKEFDGSQFDLINIFEIVSFFAIVIFAIIFIIVSKNILSDEKKNSKTERMLGYNKMQIKKYSALKMIALCFISLIIAIILSIVVITILYFIFN